MKSVVTKEQLEHVALVYKTNKEAGAAIGMHPGAFARLCRQHGILTPFVRARMERQRIEDGSG